MVSPVWMDSTGGQKGEKWEEEEEWRGGWWLVTALQGISGETVPYITWAHTDTVQLTHMKICWHTSASEDVENPLCTFLLKERGEVRGRGRRRRRKGVWKREWNRGEGREAKNGKRRWSELKKVLNELGWMQSRRHTHTHTHTHTHKCRYTHSSMLFVCQVDISGWGYQTWQPGKGRGYQRVASMRVFLFYLNWKKFDCMWVCVVWNSTHAQNAFWSWRCNFYECVVVVV